MTDPSANRKIHLALGIQSGLEKIDFPVALVISHYLYTINDNQTN